MVEAEEKAERLKVAITPMPGATRQASLKSSFNNALSAECDDAIAEMLYGLNLAPKIVEHPLFKKCVATLKTGPASYLPPTRHRCLGDLLDSTVTRLKMEEQPTREVLLKYGGTVCSDGWDDVTSSHLINILVGVSRGFFFEGTFKLSSSDSEDAQAVANLIITQIERIGETNVVQVVTDTCSVMKAAWKIIEARFPWITCTCCGPHVLSLELCDIGKIPEVAAIIAKCQKVLKRFWGKTRWPRSRLREVTAVNHGKEIGLYKAKPTRFAGKFREMARMLRVKADLKQIVVSADYAQRKFKPLAAADGEDQDCTTATATVLGSDDPVMIIVLDESNCAVLGLEPATSHR